MTETDPSTPNPETPHRRRLHQASRSRSARHLLHPAQIQESLLLAPPPSIHNSTIAGLQAAITVLIAVTVVHLSPWAHLVGYPALGALTALFGRFASMRRRRSIVGICAVLFVASVFVPSVISYAGASQPLMILLLAVWAGLATIAVSYWRLGGPGATLFVFAVGAVLGGSVETWHEVFERTAATAWGAVLAIIVCTATDRLRRTRQAGTTPPGPPSAPPQSCWGRTCMSP